MNKLRTKTNNNFKDYTVTFKTSNIQGKNKQINNYIYDSFHEKMKG